MTENMNKGRAKKKFVDFPVEGVLVFFCCDGGRFKCIKDLSYALESMSDGAFGYHVNAEKNDFYSWVKDVFKAEKMANDLLKAKTPAEMKKKIDKYLQ